MRGRGVALLLLVLCASPARGASERTPSESRCDELAALALVTTAVLESGGGSDGLLDEACRPFAEAPDPAEVRPEVARRTLVAAGRLVDRMGERRPADQAAVTAFCLGLGARYADPDPELAAAIVSWTARAVRVAYRSETRDPRDLAARLESARTLAASLDDDARAELAEASSMLVGHELESVATGLADLAGRTPDAHALVDALQTALAVRGLAPDAGVSLEQQLQGVLKPLEVRVLSDQALARGSLPWPELLDEWTAVRDDGRVTLSPPGPDVGLAVLDADGSPLALPSPAALGLSTPWVLPGLRYVLTLHGTRDVRLLVETESGGPLSTFVPTEVPGDAVLMHLLRDRGELRVVRARPWTRLEWLRFLGHELPDARVGGPGVDAFATVRYGAATPEQRSACAEPATRAEALATFASDPAAGETLRIDADLGASLRAIRAGGYQYLELLRLPGPEAPDVLALLRGLEPDAFARGGELLTSTFLSGESEARDVLVTCDMVTLAESAPREERP